jgi:excisionase family DNA binding protein
VTESVWMNTDEAAAHVGVTPRTLYRFVNDGELQAFKLGRVLRFRRTDVDAFLETKRVQPGDLEHLLAPPLRRSDILRPATEP